MRKLKNEAVAWTGWLFCEISFRCDMKYGTGLCYDIGAFFYNLDTTPTCGE